MNRRTGLSHPNLLLLKDKIKTLMMTKQPNHIGTCSVRWTIKLWFTLLFRFQNFQESLFLIHLHSTVINKWNDNKDVRRRIGPYPNYIPKESLFLYVWNGLFIKGNYSRLNSIHEYLIVYVSMSIIILVNTWNLLQNENKPIPF